MAIEIAARCVPQFRVVGTPFCGAESGDFVLIARGEAARLPRPQTTFQQWLEPPIPRKIRQYFKSISFDLSVTPIRYEYREHYLQAKLRSKRCVLLWVYPHPLIPIPIHVIAVAGHDNGIYYVFDDRAGDLAHAKELPVGNCTWTSERLLARWKGGPFATFATLAYVHSFVLKKAS